MLRGNVTVVLQNIQVNKLGGRGGGKYSNIILNAPEGREKIWGIFYRWTKGFIGGPRVFSGFIGGPRVWWTKGF